MAAVSEKPKSLSQTLAAVRKAGSRMGSLSEFSMTPVGLSTGNISLDSVTGIGGLPKGRVVELYGPPSSGKTTAALQCAALIQQQGGRVMFLDHERSLDETYVRALGVDPDGTDDSGLPSFMYDQPRSFEAGANAFRPLMQWVDLVITDSVAAMVTDVELTSLTGKVEFAARAKMMHQYMRQVTGPISDTGTCMIFLNQLQDVIDTSPMGQKLKAQGINRTTTPGGSALKFYASLRLAFKQIGNVRSEVLDPITNEMVAVPSQTKTQITVTKNKVGDPFGMTEARVRFGQGFSNEWSAFDIGHRHELFKKDGAYFRFQNPLIRPSMTNDGLAHVITNTGSFGDKGGVPWIRGEENVILVLESDPEFRGKLISAAKEAIGAGWDMKMSAEEIAEAMKDDAGSEEELKKDVESAGEDVQLPDALDLSAADLDAMFPKKGQSA